MEGNINNTDILEMISNNTIIIEMITDSIITVTFGDYKIEGSKKSLCLLGSFFQDRLDGKDSIHLDIPEDTAEGVYNLLDFHLNNYKPQAEFKDPLSCVRAIKFLHLDPNNQTCDMFLDRIDSNKSLMNEQRKEISSVFEDNFWKENILPKTIPDETDVIIDINDIDVKEVKGDTFGLDLSHQQRLLAFSKLPISIRRAWLLHHNNDRCLRNQEIYHIGDDKGIIISLNRDMIRKVSKPPTFIDRISRSFWNIIGL